MKSHRNIKKDVLKVKDLGISELSSHWEMSKTVKQTAVL